MNRTSEQALRAIEEQARRAVKKVEAYGEEAREKERERLEENKRLNEEARARRLASEAEAKAERERERARLDEMPRREDEARLKGGMRERFLAANPSATADDFERLWPQMRDEHFKREADEAHERQKRAMLASGMYGGL